MQIRLPMSVLIPTMNRSNTLRNTIESYLDADYIPDQIVIIDQSKNESDQNDNENILKELCENKVDYKYVYQKEPSLTKARNTAISFAKNEIIICSDDDIIVYNNTLRYINEIMKRNDIALIAGIDDNSKVSTSKIGYFFGTKSFSKRNIGHVTKSVLGRYPQKIKGETATEWAMGYFFVIRRNLIEKWGIKWDENLIGYAYPEDLDFSYWYCRCAKHENYKSILNENVRVKHMVSTEYRIPTKNNTYMYVINRLYLSYKYKMGFMSRMAQNWCNFWMLINKFIKKENYKDMLAAMRIARKYKAQIAKGELSTLYDK